LQRSWIATKLNLVCCYIYIYIYNIYIIYINIHIYITQSTYSTHDQFTLLTLLTQSTYLTLHTQLSNLRAHQLTNSPTYATHATHLCDTEGGAIALVIRECPQSVHKGQLLQRQMRGPVCLFMCQTRPSTCQKRPSMSVAEYLGFTESGARALCLGSLLREESR